MIQCTQMNLHNPPKPCFDPNFILCRPCDCMSIFRRNAQFNVPSAWHLPFLAKKFSWIFDISGQGKRFWQGRQDSARFFKIVERNRRKPRCQALGNFDALNSRLKSVLYCRRNCKSWFDSTCDSTRSNLCDVKQTSSRKRKKLKYEHTQACMQ